MARAKNTTRAEARRRSRAARSASIAEDDSQFDDDALEEAPPDAPARSRFKLPDVRADLVALPGVLRSTKLLWLPFLVIISAFLLGEAGHAGYLPPDLANLAYAYVQLVLPPQALIVYFIGGFLAPRGSYLIGLMLGLLSAPLYVTWLWGVPGTPEAAAAQGVTFESLLFTYTAQGALFGMLAAGFASWYRGFLRQSQERARANRIARDQQQRVKAKEQERKDREAARVAAREAREAQKTAAQKPTT